MDVNQEVGPPIACSLSAGDYKERLAWLGDLARNGLRESSRDDLTLTLSYGPSMGERVATMVRQEQACCAFLRFEVQDTPDGIRVVITAPEPARGIVDELFAQFAPALDQPGGALAPALGACPS